MNSKLLSLYLVLFTAGAAQAQDPADIIKKYFCEVAGQKPVEDGACSLLCNGLATIVEVPEGMCLPLMEKGWDYLAGMCGTNTRQVATTQALADPSPGDVIEELLCKLAKNDQAKEAFDTHVCESLVSNHTLEQEACDKAFEELWDLVAKKCPPEVAGDGKEPAGISTIVV